MSATSLIDRSRGVDGPVPLSSVEVSVMLNHSPKRPQKSDRKGVGGPSLLSPASIFVEIKRRLIFKLGSVGAISARCRGYRLAGPAERRPRG